jgi:hypothetical protein
LPNPPKILIVADSPNWAYSEIQREVIENLRHKYDFYFDFTCCHHFKTNDYKDGFLEDLFYRLKHNIKSLFYPVKFKKCQGFKYTPPPFWVTKFSYSNKIYRRRVLPP